ncbi:MAG: pyridoxal-5-phosphate-dependent protein subunit beta, partial [Bacteroidetes bacterium HGW-Bacteroidetes-22]
RLLRLFNEPAGISWLKENGITPGIADKLQLIGISGIANLLSAIKTAKQFEMNNDDIILSIATDSVELYGSRLQELRAGRGEYTAMQAGRDFEGCLMAESTGNMKELTYADRKAIHNLKYFTWVEQQAKPVEELNQLWYDRNIWADLFGQAAIWDTMIEDFNREVAKS